MNASRVLVTGATGFVGGALVRALAERGTEVHALARPGADRSQLRDIKVTWHEGDITSAQGLEEIFAEATCIIHAAGRLGEAGVPEEVYRHLHVDGTRNVMTAALATGNVERLVHVSSPGVLGPIRGAPATEDFPYAPTNPYERAKAAAEEVALAFADRGLPVIVARPEFIYGPGDRHVLRLFQAIQRGRFFYIHGGEHFCHPTFIADAVNGMLLCLKSGRPGEVYHLAGPRPVTFRELCETIAAALDVRPPWLSLPRWGAMLGATALEAMARMVGCKPALSKTSVDFFSADRRSCWEKASNELGYAPCHNLVEGVAKTVEWYRQRQWL